MKNNGNFKFRDVLTWLIRNTCNAHIAQISRSKGNQKMKLRQSIEYKKRNVFIKNYAKNEARRIVPDLFLFLKNA